MPNLRLKKPSLRFEDPEIELKFITQPQFHSHIKIYLTILLLQQSFALVQTYVMKKDLEAEQYRIWVIVMRLL